MNYGLTNSTNLEALVIDVCKSLGFGQYNTAHLLILETMGAETGRGKTTDKSTFAGMGLCQFDKMPFYDVRDRTSKKTKEKVFNDFGIVLELVEWEHLRYNPFLSVLFCRLKYILVSDPIPPLIDGRAFYWKKFYNSFAGKGTIDHYIYANMAYRESDEKLLKW